MGSHREIQLSILAIRLSTVAVVALTAASAWASPPPDAPGKATYLALGDSVPFGFIASAGHAYVNANNFIGYPSYVGDDLRLDTANAACPGETTTSFELPGAPDEGCGAFRAQFPLHVSYGTTQLQFAESFLATHNQARLVTISLGANDVFLLEDQCSGSPQCIVSGLPSVLSTVYSNVSSILSSIRGTGFRGVLMVVNYYSPDYTDLQETGVIAELNHILATAATANGAVLADAFTAFRIVASTHAGGQTCVAGLLNANAQDELLCDVHASQSGQQLLADTIASTYRAAATGGNAN